MRLTAAFLLNIWMVSAQVPADPDELVTGAVAAKAMDRTEALAILNKAKQPMRLLAPMTPHYLMTVSFTAKADDPANSGPGEFTELWLGPKNWRWTANMGSFAVNRVSTQAGTFDEKPAGVAPMRLHMLRNSIFWAGQGLTASSQFRSAHVQWNGRATTCLLVSDRPDPGEVIASRRWDESEYCIDDKTSLLQILSVAPGNYVVYSYSGQSFHGRPMPDRIKTYIAGSLAIDAAFHLDEPDVAEGTVLTATPEAMAGAKPVVLDEPLFELVVEPNASASGTVIVNAQIGPDGNVVVAEMCAASDRSLVAAALESATSRLNSKMVVRDGVQRQAYVQVRFIPGAAAPAVTTAARIAPPSIPIEPYYLERTFFDPSQNARSKEIIARRADGAEMRMNTVGPADQEKYVRDLKFPDGRWVRVVDSVKAKVTWPKLNEFEKQRLGSSKLAAADCYASIGNGKLLRRDEVEGQDAVVVERTAGDFRMTMWQAPKLGCEIVYSKSEAMLGTGAFRPSGETKTTRLVIGEPEAKLFEIGPDLVEMKPSEAERKLLESLDLPAEVRAAMEREAQNMGAADDKRYQSKQ